VTYYPNEHKLAGVKYLIDRLLTYPLAKHAEEAELDIIKLVLKNSKYRVTHIHKNLKKITEVRISKKILTNRKVKKGLCSRT
jgi:hypothetical protein